MKKIKDKLIRTQQIKIKKGHKLFNYFDELCFKSKNLYNVSNYYFRQVLTGIQKDKPTPNEKEIIDIINSNIPIVNKIKIDNVKKQRLKKPETPDAKLYEPLDKENKYLNYELLDAIFKITKQVDYYSLPSHSNQGVMKLLFQDWDSYFEAIKDYRVNPSKYKGQPKIPSYAKKSGRKVAFFTNQTCTIKDNKYLRFPKTKHKLNIGKLGNIDGKLKQVRVVPYNNYFEVELIFELKEKLPSLKTKEPKNILGIDLGIDNFATISNNIDQPPMIVKGKVLKSINQFYNKERAYYYSILRQGKGPKEGLFTSNKLNKLDKKRNAKIKDFLHKVSFNIINYAEKYSIDTIVIGKNDNWKDNIKLRKKDKLNFATIPYSLFIELITYKAEAKGIRVIIQEESYTSKASFLDNDDIPTFGEIEIKPKFSGKRIKRGLYKSASGEVINADINGSLNIIRKAIPNAFNNKLWNRGLVFQPLVLIVR